jgi:hypothetical protein
MCTEIILLTFLLVALETVVNLLRIIKIIELKTINSRRVIKVLGYREGSHKYLYRKAIVKVQARVQVKANFQAKVKAKAKVSQTIEFIIIIF